MTEEIRKQIKQTNLLRIKEKKYSFIDWLPILERPSVRVLEDIKGRMSVMNALIEISFNTPIKQIRIWIEKNNLEKFLSQKERETLNKNEESLSDEEFYSYRWYLESLWALMWVLGMIEELDETEWCADYMESLLPNVLENENNNKIEVIFKMKTNVEIFTMLDYYFRLHWYCVNERLENRNAIIDEGLVYYRRKAIEWVMNPGLNWDNIEMNT